MGEKVSIQVDISIEIELIGDPMRLEQIFRILVDNALKFSREKSHVIGRLYRTEHIISCSGPLDSYRTVYSCISDAK